MITYLKDDYPKLSAWLEKRGVMLIDLDPAICRALYDFDHLGSHEFNGETLQPDTVGYMSVEPTFMDKLFEKQVKEVLVNLFKGLKAMEKSDCN